MSKPRSLQPHAPGLAWALLFGGWLIAGCSQPEAPAPERLAVRLPIEGLRQDTGWFARQAPQKPKVWRFAPIADSLRRTQPAALCAELAQQLGDLPCPCTNPRLQRFALTGSTASGVFLLETDQPCDTSRPRAQFLFDAEGHLLHRDRALSMRPMSVFDDTTQLLYTIEAVDNQQNPEGQAHLYKLQSGALVDLLDVVTENTPPAYSPVRYRPAELRLALRDLNQDSLPDLVFEGLATRTDPKNRVLRLDPVRYVFLYRPSKELFVYSPE